MAELVWRYFARLVASFYLVFGCIHLFTYYFEYQRLVLNLDSLAKILDRWTDESKPMVSRDLDVIFYICCVDLAVHVAFTTVILCSNAILISATHYKTETKVAARSSKIWILINCILLTVQLFKIVYLLQTNSQFDWTLATWTVVRMLCLPIVQKYRTELEKSQSPVQSPLIIYGWNISKFFD